jgi:hypothetical protein
MHLTFMGAKVLNIIEYHKYFWIFFALWIVFRTFAEKENNRDDTKTHSPLLV